MWDSAAWPLNRQMLAARHAVMQVFSTQFACGGLTRHVQAQEVAVSVTNVRLHLRASVRVVMLAMILVIMLEDLIYIFEYIPAHGSLCVPRKS